MPAPGRTAPTSTGGEGAWVSLPVSEFEALHARIRELEAIATPDHTGGCMCWMCVAVRIGRGENARLRTLLERMLRSDDAVQMAWGEEIRSALKHG